MITIEKIFENNQKWLEQKQKEDPLFFEKLAKGQHPDILYIGCSDSRVTAEELMGVQPGEVFVHRNIANIVPNTDVSAMAVIDYAVSHLKVKHIVVCGHYQCGGIKDALQLSNLGILNPWLRNVRDVYRLHYNELNAITNERKRYDRLVELNVEEQCFNVIKTAGVFRLIKENKITVHGLVFDIYTGKLIDLKLDLKKMIDQVGRIFRV